MKSFKQFIDDIYEHNLYEMANVPSRFSGVGPSILVSSKYAHEGKVSKHGPRVKVSNVNGRYAHDDNFTMTVDDEPEIIGNCKLKSHQVDDIKDWIKLNRDHLHDVWHNGLDMDPQDLLDKIKKL